ENYAPFVLAVVVYCLLGLAASRGKVSRWWTLFPLALAIYFHIFGTLLLPSLLYLILHDTGPGKWLDSLPSSTKLLSVLVVIIVGAITYYLLYTHYYFFTFALLPLIPDRFTVEHDTLTSFKHIIDTVNLLVLLLPGLPVLLLAFFSSPQGGVLRNSGYRFLAVAGLTILAAVYAFNPGIGMPRNWDLFSVVGVPLAVLAYAVILDENRPTTRQVPAAVFSIALSLLSLGPRVASQVMPNIGIAHFRSYLTLDKIRNRNARSLLVDYYAATGDTAAANFEQRHAEEDFPESVLNKQAKQLMAQGKFNDARRVLERAIQIDPIYPDAYGQMGVCFIQLGQIDTALTLFKIADGLNPYNAQTMNNVATAYLRKKDYSTAEKEFLQSLAVDSTTLETLAGLASTYLALGQFERSIDFVSRLAVRTDMTADYFRQAGDAYASKGAYPQAARAFGYALARGLDSSYVRQVQQKYPQLKVIP
ncbi:MAG TPA: tetratricopeptide repeat protein, partial [Candidatus Acidoferrum sp.]|nr:tetratricopeptide repeat protein [Candidatus Acidoferrum sp.]